MLLNKPYAVNDVITIKLTNGEEIIARYNSETLTEYIISKPVSLTQTQAGNIGLMPTVFSADLNSNMNLLKTVVAMVTHTSKKFADEYIRATSGIKPASSLEGLIDAKGSA